MASEKQIQADQQNALKSSGPKSAEGKRTVSGNRITHGILSKKLLLAVESAEEYQALLDGLTADLSPVGMLGLTLVEKLAVVIWRQWRLVAAETSAIELSTPTKKALSGVCSGLGIPDYGSQALTNSDVSPPDPEQQAWCSVVIAEYKSEEEIDLSELNARCPLIYQQLIGDAGREGAIKNY